MSTPLAADKVKEIREIFDYQLEHPENNKPAPKMKPTENSLRKEKEAVLARLASFKETLDTKMQQPAVAVAARPPTPPPPHMQDANQTLDVNPVDDTWMQGSDESFLRLEQDCDNTVLPARSQQQQYNDPEMAAIDRLMREYQLDHGRGVASHDQTQLEDVEPPSGIWDTTVAAAKMGTSPVKMIHALRPSTIIEETLSSNLSVASSSYKTAASGFSKVAPSERYDTATDNTICLTSSSDSSSSNVIEIMDDSLEVVEGKQPQKRSSGGGGDTTDESASSVSTVPMTQLGNATLDGVSSLLPDSTIGSSASKDSGDFSLPDSLGDTPDFNDTLERIEFMEQQGRKWLEQQKTQSQTKPIITTATVAADPSTPNVAKTLLPASTTKRVFYPSPTSAHSPSSAFKKPGAVRSPQVKFVATQKRNFDHIVSPIATYIKDVPQSTMYTKYKGQCLFSKSSPIKPQSTAAAATGAKHQDTQETKENKQSQLKPPQWNIPRKVFTATNNRHEIDNRQVTKIPGGSKVHQMVQPALGNPHTITRHEGRVKMDLHPSQQQPRDSIFDETLANMSVVSGDVSIQVIRDMKKH